MSNKELAKHLLKSKKCRITEIRNDIINCLADSHHAHTISDIVSHLSIKNKKVNLTSVYNNLNFLLQEGIVDICINRKTHQLTYELIHLNSEPHIHVYEYGSKKDAMLVNFPQEILDILNQEMQKKNMEIVRVHMDLIAKKKN